MTITYSDAEFLKMGRSATHLAAMARFLARWNEQWLLIDSALRLSFAGASLQ